MTKDNVTNIKDIEQALKEDETDVPVGEQVPGFNAYASAIQGVYQAAYEVVAPFSENATISHSYGEVLRYLEVASLYMDRIAFMITNPQLLPSEGDDADATS